MVLVMAARFPRGFLFWMFLQFFVQPVGSLTSGAHFYCNLHDTKNVLLQNAGSGRFYFFKTTIFGGNNHRIWHAYFIASSGIAFTKLLFYESFWCSEIQGAIHRELVEATFREHFEATFREHF